MLGESQIRRKQGGKTKLSATRIVMILVGKQSAIHFLQFNRLNEMIIGGSHPLSFTIVKQSVGT